MKLSKSIITRYVITLCMVVIVGISAQKAYATDIFYQIHQFIETPIIRLIANILVSKLNNRIASSILNVGYAGLDMATDQSQDPSQTGSTGQPNDRCSSDDDCSSPYVCNANSVCGYSNGKGQALDKCSTSADCASPYVCNTNNVCGYSNRGSVAFGGRCTKTSDCSTPYVCNANSICGYTSSSGTSSSSGGGSSGGPSFITNWRDEILQTESRGNDIFRTLLANTQFCPHLDASIKSLFLADRYPGGSSYQPGSTSESSGHAGPGEACVQTSDCSSGNFCLGGICAPNTGVADNKPDGSQCKNDNECSSGICNAFICAVRSGNGKSGDRCTDSSFCGVGLICSSDNICTSDASSSKNKGTGNAVLGLASDIASQLTPGGTTPFGLQTRCTLPSNFNIDLFNKDFSKGGGFEAWDRLLQDPQNNFVGALFITAGQQAIEQARTQKAEDQERLTSNGFKSKRDTGGTGGGLCSYSQKVFGRCLSKSDVTTPAGILNIAAGQTITSSVQRMIEAHDWVDLVGALVDIVGQQIQNFSKNGANTPENIPAVKNGSDYTSYYPNDITGNDGTNEYTDLNICLNNCATSGTTTCNEKDPSAQQTCINNAKLACYADCSSKTTAPKTQRQAQVGDTCENPDGTANSDICGTALFCAKDQTPKICLECSSTIACISPNKTCDQGVCVAPGGNKRGESCVADNQCKAGLFCNQNHHCRPIKNGQGPTSQSGTTTGAIIISVSSNVARNEDGDPSVKVGQPLVFNVDGLPSSSTGHIDYIRDDGTTISNNFSTNDVNPQPTTSFNFNPGPNDVGIWTAQVFIDNSTTTSDEFFFEVTQ